MISDLFVQNAQIKKIMDSVELQMETLEQERDSLHWWNFCRKTQIQRGLDFRRGKISGIQSAAFVYESQ